MTAPPDLRFTRRAVFVGGAMATVGATLAGRMAYLSVWQGAKYAAQAEGNRVSLRLIPPRRGWIVDRSGKPLALNQPDYRLELLPDQVTDIAATLAAVQKILPLTPDDLDRIHADLARQPKYMPVEIAHGLDWPTFARINVNLPDLPGVQPLPGFVRVYPGGDAFAHLLGYVGTPTPDQFARERDPLLIFPGFKIGKDGIERRADASLRGVAGARRVEVTARGRVVRDLDTHADVPGKTLRLTIDRDLQSYAARRLTDNSASIVVMDCNSGDVLCMVSMPAYDPNVFSTRVTAKLWAELQADDHHPLVNKSAQGLYPPGSTFKTMTVARRAGGRASRPTPRRDAPAPITSATRSGTASRSAATAGSTCTRRSRRAAISISTPSAARSGSTPSPRPRASSDWGRSSTCRWPDSRPGSSPTRRGSLPATRNRGASAKRSIRRSARDISSPTRCSWR